MVEFNTTYDPMAYSHPMDRGYMGNNALEPGQPANIEKPIVPINELGQTVTEGQRFGTLLQTTTAAIKTGAGSIELQTIMGGGGEPGGAEAYGKDARETLREIAKANEVTLTSIHTPTNIGNMSGFNAQQGNFSDDFRKVQLEEVRKAIRFAGDAARGGAVVVHTGEFQRPMFDADWNKDNLFVGYDEEPDRAVKPLVDIRTGRVISEVRKNQIVPRAIWNRYESENKDFWDEHGGSSYVDEKGNTVNPGDYIDFEGNKIERKYRVPRYNKEKNSFDVEEVKWKYFVDEAKEINNEKAKENGLRLEDFRKQYPNEYLTPEEAFLHATTETQEKIAEGWAGYHADRLKDYFEGLKELKKAKKFYDSLEKNIPEDEKWKLLKDKMPQVGRYGISGAEYLVSTGKKMPSELIAEGIKDVKDNIEHTQDMIVGQIQSAREQKILRQHAKSTKKYAMKKTMQSYAETGIEAMKQSHNNPYVQRDIFVAPENIFPEMGYGSHPEELIELVQNARKEMVNHLTEKYIEDPSGKTDNGNPVMIPNPNYTGMPKEEAMKEAKQHIKATFDTQHLGMWWKHFNPKPGETEDKRRERFNNWYMEEVKKMDDAGIIGNIHLVDSLGGGHHHLPAGQGDLPVVEAIKYLKKKGYKGYINSEAYEEERFGQGRILLETWRAFDAPIYSFAPPAAPAPGTWGRTYHGYFGRTTPPLYIFGAYSPSNDWTLWSQVPME